MESVLGRVNDQGHDIDDLPLSDPREEPTEHPDGMLAVLFSQFRPILGVGRHRAWVRGNQDGVGVDVLSPGVVVVPSVVRGVVGRLVEPGSQVGDAPASRGGGASSVHSMGDAVVHRGRGKRVPFVLEPPCETVEVATRGQGFEHRDHIATVERALGGLQQASCTVKPRVALVHHGPVSGRSRAAAAAPIPISLGAQQCVPCTPAGSIK